MGLGKWLLGGVVGGIVGATVWALITYFTDHEIGWIPWGIGFVVGLGVRIMAGETSGFAPGITAAAIAIVAVLAGKYAAVALLIGKMERDFPAMAIIADDILVRHADIIVEARKADKKAIQWPANKDEHEA